MKKKEYKNKYFKNVCLEKIKFEDVLFKEESEKESILRWFSHSNKCRYCRKTINDIDFDITYGYWQAVCYPCHIICKNEGYEEEKFECQKIDADCNDCISFLRHEENNGTCTITNEKTTAYPNFCSSKKCFKHREGIK